MNYLTKKRNLKRHNSTPLRQRKIKESTKLLKLKTIKKDLPESPK